MTITPDQARALLDGATPGPWEWRKHGFRGSGRDFDSLGPSAECCALETQDAEDYASWVVADDEDKALIAAAPDLAQTVAGMEWQWSVERLTEDGSLWLIDRPWTCDRELAETWLRKYDGSRLVRRLVGPVAEGDYGEYPRFNIDRFNNEEIF